MAQTLTPPRPQWLVDLSPSPSASKPKQSYPDPLGFQILSKQQKSSNSKAIAQPRKQPTASEMDTLKIKKAWELALAPAKQVSHPRHPTTTPLGGLVASLLTPCNSYQ